MSTFRRVHLLKRLTIDGLDVLLVKPSVVDKGTFGEVDLGSLGRLALNAIRRVIVDRGAHW
jgi:hypothetical protein